MQMCVPLKGQSIPGVITGSSIKERPVSLDRGKCVFSSYRVSRGLGSSGFGDLSESSHIPSLQFSDSLFSPNQFLNFH